MVRDWAVPTATLFQVFEPHMVVGSKITFLWLDPFLAFYVRKGQPLAAGECHSPTKKAA